MAQSFFIFNGIDCRSRGVTMRGPAPIIRPEERVKHVEIPGRSGDVTETEAEDENIFNSYIQTISITVRGAHNVRNIFNWLRGSGYVTFSGEPDRRQKARVIGAITLNRISRNMDKWAGEVQMYCQPLKELLINERVTITPTAYDIVNRGDVKSRPRITATASAATMVIYLGNVGLTITGLTSGNDYIIDCDTMEVTTALGASVTKNSVGGFPKLPVGLSPVQGSGWSKLVIDRRERFL